jgi:hypothetical protein
MVAAAVIGGSVLSAGVGALSSSSASKSAAAGANQAAQLNQSQFDQTLANQRPFMKVGENSLPYLENLSRGGTTDGGTNYLGIAEGRVPFNGMTQAEVEQTPGYQFNLSQGLKSTQSAAAARGLGVSGAALKGAATYATGLADSTYQNQFANKQAILGDYINLNTAQQGNINNQFNRLNSVATLGENAATQTGMQGTQAANNAGGFLNQAGQATAAGTVGAGNAISGGLNNYLAYQGYQNSGGTGGYGTSGYGTSYNPNNWNGATPPGLY